MVSVVLILLHRFVHLVMVDQLGQKPGFLAIDLLVTVAIGLWTTLVGLASIAGVDGWVGLGLVATLFAPGYSVVAALFPRAAPSQDPLRPKPNVNLVQRGVLAIGLSVCVVPLLGLGIHYVTGDLRPGLLLSSVGVFTISLTVIAAAGRQLTPPEHRFSLQFSERIRGVAQTARTASGVTVLLVVGLLIASAGIGLTAVTTESGEDFTEFYLLAQDNTTSADTYSEELSRNDTTQLRVGITNQEGEPTSYTVIAQLHSVEDGTVQQTQQLDQFTVSATQGETVRREHTITPMLTGDRLRLAYLLYLGDPPAESDRTTDTAYRHIHFWVSVSP